MYTLVKRLTLLPAIIGGLSHPSKAWPGFFSWKNPPSQLAQLALWYINNVHSTAWWCNNHGYYMVIIWLMLVNNNYLLGGAMCPS
jgi:hypothetical protein